jgi:uncharacterized Zn finger protein
MDAVGRGEGERRRMFEIKPFTDLLDALRDLTQDVLAIAQLPRKRRDEVLTVLSETYQLLDRTLLMVIGRIGRVLDRAERDAREEFAHDLSELQWDEKWLASTRELSLSSGLRRLHREMERAVTGLAARKAVKDWKTLSRIMDSTMHDEIGLAQQISADLSGLSRFAEGARTSDEGFARAQVELATTREALEGQRKRLILDESKIYAVL